MGDSADDLSQQFIEACNQAYGTHPGRRALHARGFCAAGRFRPHPVAAEYSKAQHFNAEVPVVARFSNGAGHPGAPDAARVPRGFAIKFQLDGGAITDQVSIDAPVFATRGPDGFLDLLRSSAPDPKTGAPDPARLQAFLGRHPEAAARMGDDGRRPSSYAACTYFPIHAFYLQNASGTERCVRYRWVPEAEAPPHTVAAAAKLAPSYLDDELRRRLADGPVAFRLVLQLAAPGDDPTDPSRAWPDDRPLIEVGRLLLDSADASCDGLVFDPTNVVPGIRCSDDPVLHARRAAYSLSYERRAR